MLNLAKVYGVSTKRLNEQIKRNRERFPEDFMFQLTIEEARAIQRSSNEELARKLDEVEKKYDHQFKTVFEAIRELLTPPPVKIKPIGFRVKALKK